MYLFCSSPGFAEQLFFFTLFPFGHVWQFSCILDIALKIVVSVCAIEAGKTLKII